MRYALANKAVTPLAIAKTPTIFALGAVTAIISPTDIKEIIIAVGVFIAGVGVVVVNIINARAQSRKLDAQREKIESVARTTDVIAGHVNSEKTEAAGKLATSQKENAMLREMLADKKETAGLLAQAAATTAPPPVDKTKP